MSATFDTHAAVRELRAADFTEQQAEALVRVLAHAVGEPVAKTDFDAAVKDLDARFKDLGTVVRGIDARLKGLGATVTGLAAVVRDIDARLKGIDARLKGLVSAVNDLRARTDVRLAELETRLIKWMVGMTFQRGGTA